MTEASGDAAQADYGSTAVDRPAPPPHFARVMEIGPGFGLAVVIALAASFISIRQGGSAMLYALLLGIAFSFLSEEKKCADGIVFAAKPVLRFGVALLGVRIAISDITSLGAPTVFLVIACVSLTIAIGWRLGRALGLSNSLSILSAGAVAICGASAALAISAVLPARRDLERNTLLVVAGVTTLSTIAMVVYPFAGDVLGFSDRAIGILIGVTIHDVAQVVGAGYMVSIEAGDTATIVKLMRVVCLVPVVMTISYLFHNTHKDETAGQSQRAAPNPPLLPGFLVGFLCLVAANSMGVLPEAAIPVLSDTSKWCLLIAVAALGLKTSLREIVHIGPRPVVALVLQTLFLFGVAAAVLTANLV